MYYDKPHRKSIVCSTHLIPLIKAFDASEGDVLEIGTGYYSTPLLSWLCEVFERRLVSFDNQSKWFDRTKRGRPENQELYLVDDWNKADIENNHWGLVFIDHIPNGRRWEEIKRLKDKADYIVIHDSEDFKDKIYHYSRIYSLFKYRYDYTKTLPNTTVLSNFKQLWS